MGIWKMLVMSNWKMTSNLFLSALWQKRSDDQFLLWLFLYWCSLPFSGVLTHVAVFETPCIMSCQQMGRVKNLTMNPRGLHYHRCSHFRGAAARYKKGFPIETCFNFTNSSFQKVGNPAEFKWWVGFWLQIAGQIF